MSEPKEQALFDSSRKALIFALNAHQVEMPRPSMNVAMAEPTKRILKRGEQPRVEEVEDTRKTNYSTTPVLRGLEKAAQAGMILQHLARLDDTHQQVLRGLLIVPYDPCLCQAPCCSGWRANKRWRQATLEMCATLQTDADITKTPGHKGLSTQPTLRMLLVEDYYRKVGPTLTEIAARSQVSYVTATRHKDWIHTYLAGLEQEAWLQIDAILDQAGITRFIG